MAGRISLPGHLSSHGGSKSVTCQTGGHCEHPIKTARISDRYLPGTSRHKWSWCLPRETRGNSLVSKQGLGCVVKGESQAGMLWTAPTDRPSPFHSPKGKM